MPKKGFFSLCVCQILKFTSITLFALEVKGPILVCVCVYVEGDGWGGWFVRVGGKGVDSCV